MKTDTLIYLAFLIIVIFCGCAHDPRNTMVKLEAIPDESQIVVACPDDGSHFVANGKCLKEEGDIERTVHQDLQLPDPCPSDGRHERVNGVCVDILGK
jgi:hypothetical protein